MNGKASFLRARLRRLGPGLMFAGVAIGVSHLVFSTQAGANYGLSLVWLIPLISLLKYPAFRFAVDYASATGRSLVPAYAVFIVLATIASLPQIGDGDRAIFAELEPSRALVVFMIAMAGWMPIPTNGAILISAWVRGKRVAAGGEFDARMARSDFHVGFTLTIILAVCFLLLGTAVLFDTGREVIDSAGGFATDLLSVFTASIGSWAYPVIAIAAIAVMWSTLIALMDVMPRVTSRLFGILTHRPDAAATPYAAFLALQVAGCSLILWFLMSSFNSFVMFATSVGFMTAPAVAYYNYVAIRSDDVPPELRPGRFITVWNWFAIAAMIVFAIGFLYTSLF